MATFLPPPCRKHKGISLQYSLLESARDPQGEIHKSAGGLRRRLPWRFYLSSVSTLSFQQFFNYSSRFPTLALVPIEVFAPGFIHCNILCLSVSSLRGCGLLCDLISLMNLKGVTDFQFVQLFNCC